MSPKNFPLKALKHKAVQSVLKALIVAPVALMPVSLVSAPPPAQAQTACDTQIRYVTFTGKTSGSQTGKPNVNTNLRSNTTTSASILTTIPPNTTLTFSGWTYGDKVNDLWTGQGDSRWFRTTYNGKPGWVASGVIYGNPPNSSLVPNCSPSLPSPLLTIQPPQYFLDRPSFYGSGNGYARSGYGSSTTGTNYYREGNCTWYAYGRLKQLGFNPDDIMSGYPNANQWGNVLRNGAYITSSPQPGDVAQWYLNGQNHVAIVEKTEGNDVWLSESQAYSNYDGNLPGWEYYPGAGTLHRIVKYTQSSAHRYIRLRK